MNNKITSKRLYTFITTGLFILVYCQAISAQENAAAVKLSLQECISLALENNHQLKASAENIKVSEAQVKQAASAYYPQVNLSGSYSFMDQPPMFVMPSFNIPIPELPFIGSMNFRVPQQDVKLMDRQNIQSRLDLLYPLFTGGKISAVNKQANAGYEISRFESDKMKQQVIYNTRRCYYACILAKKLAALGHEALERLNATLSLTETMYKEGSGSVTKIDYLKNKLTVEQVAAIVIELDKNVKTTFESLKFLTGLEINSEFDLQEEEIPYSPVKTSFEEYSAQAIAGNPEYLKVIKAEEVFTAKKQEAQSGYYPRIALFANVNAIINSYQYGFVNKDNKFMWAVGVGVDYPLFSGFRTQAEVEQSESELRKFTEEKLLLHNAIILQLKEAYLKESAAAEQSEKMKQAVTTAVENTSLTERAFHRDIVKADDLIQAQIMESLASAQYQKALYDHLEAVLLLEMLSGKF